MFQRRRLYTTDVLVEEITIDILVEEFTSSIQSTATSKAKASGKGGGSECKWKDHVWPSRKKNEVVEDMLPKDRDV